MQLAAASECVPHFRSHNAFPFRSVYVLLVLLLLIPPVSRSATTDVLYIGGTAPTTITAPGNYWFRPWVRGTNTSHLTFHVQDLPPWASFNTKTGALSGRTVPGTYARIAIAVTDGHKTAWTPLWTIVVLPSGAKPPVPPPTNPTPPPTNPTPPPTNPTPPPTNPTPPPTNPTPPPTNPTPPPTNPTPPPTNPTPPPTNPTPPPTNPTPPPTNPTPPIPDIPNISGAPATSVAVGAAYSFQPTASDPQGAKLSFSVNTKPSWASFDTTSGRLAGSPAAANVGTTSNIIITASNGKATASLPAFSLSVTQTTNGSATLSWQPPTRNTDGSALTNLAGYQIDYGTSPSSLTHTVQVATPGATQYVVSNLSTGTWYFAISADTSGGSQSAFTAVVSKTIN